MALFWILNSISAKTDTNLHAISQCMASLEEQIKHKEDIITTLNTEIRVYKEQHDALIKLGEENDKLREKNKKLTEKISL